MTTKLRLPLYLNWKALKNLGWTYGRAHTDRLMYDPEYEDRRFPEPTNKDQGVVRGHRLWYAPDVIDYFKRHGFKVPDEIVYG